MSGTGPLVIFETPTEVRKALVEFMTMRYGLYNLPFILEEAQKTMPSLNMSNIDHFIGDKKMDPRTFAGAFIGVYCFLERYREEAGIAKTPKRVVLEQLYQRKKDSVVCLE